MFSTPLIQQLGQTLIHFLWQGAVVGIILWTALLFIQKASLRYALTLFALFALLLLPVITFIELRWPPETVQPPESLPAAVKPEVHPDQLEPAQPALQQAPEIAKTHRGYMPYLVLTWFIGVTLLSLKFMLECLSLWRLRYTSIHLAKQEVQLRLLDLSRKLGIKRSVLLLESGLAKVPMVIGLLRPVILLPLSAVSGLSAKQLEMILAHELAHIKRFDYLVTYIQALVEALLFYHPVVWWVSYKLRQEREHCCDDIVISLLGNPKDYAQTLVQLSESYSFAPAVSGGDMYTRIYRLLYPRQMRQGSSYLLASLSVLGLLVTLLMISFLNVHAQEQMPQIWASVAGKVTFSDDYREILDMASDAFVVIEERNGDVNRKVKVTKVLEDSAVESQEVIGAFAYSYMENGQSVPFDETAQTWYQQAFSHSIENLYMQTPVENRTWMIGTNDVINGYEVWLDINHFLDFVNRVNFSALHIYDQSKESILELWQNDLRLAVQRHSHGLMTDFDLARTLDEIIADTSIPTELYPSIYETINLIGDSVLRQQLTQLANDAEKKPRTPGLALVGVEVSEFHQPLAFTDSPDGKNLITGFIVHNRQPLANHKVNLHNPMGMTNPGDGAIVATAITDSKGEFRFEGIESGDYELWTEDNEMYQGLGISTHIDKQHLEVYLSIARWSKIISPKDQQIVSTTPNLQWESVPDASFYSVDVFDNATGKYVFHRNTQTTSSQINLPLEANTEFQWYVIAYDASGESLASSDLGIFRTE